MDWLQFAADVIKSLSWPLAIVLIAFNFKAELVSLIGRIRKIKHKETEFEFREVLRDAAKAIGKDEEALQTEPLTKSDIQSLEDLASMSPRAAILEAWIRIEQVLWRHIETSFKGEKPPGLMRQRNPLDMVRYMGDLPPDDAAFLRNMRRLRNLAAHSEEFTLTSASAKKYLTLVDEFLSRWKRE